MLKLTQFWSKLLLAFKNKNLVVHFPYSKLTYNCSRELLKQGFIQSLELSKKTKTFFLILKSNKDFHIKQYSTCSKHVYWKLSDIPLKSSFILSTSKGILSNKEAFKKQVGGKVLCQIDTK